MLKVFKFILLFILVLIPFDIRILNCQQPDSAKKTKQFMQDAKVVTDKKSIIMTIRNVDIGKFPEINIIVEAFDVNGAPLDTLLPKDVMVVENGVDKKIISIRKISVKERVPVDFVFLIDITGSMQKYIDATKNYISTFTNSLVQRGIDYRIGLILFGDLIEKIYQPTDNIQTFLQWLSPVRAFGGGDEKENGLEAFRSATEMQFRASANRVAVLISDAPYHQQGEKGDGTTDLTTKSATELLVEKDVRLFAIVPPRLREYKTITDKTRGNFFDIDYPFSTILDNFSNQLTNLYAIKYRTDLPAIPDSINIALLNENKKELVRKTIPIVELGRKLIIENLLYETNSSRLSDSVIELDVLKEFMKNKPNVVILVEGHTDDRGGSRLNDQLSLSRAESVKAYLTRRGIKANRIKTVGFGKRRPIASNDTDFGRRLNRRTEIVIVAK